MDVCAIDITAEQRKTVLALLARHLPNTTAWVYGSRVKWTSRPESDLDLVVFAKPEQERRVSDLREAFEESNLPFRVDLFVWDEVPEQFRKQIEAEHVVLVEREERGVGGEWPIMSLREASVSLIDCEHRTPPAAERGYPYVAIPQVKDGRINLNGVRRITRERFDEWTRKADPKSFDIVLSRRCNPGETGFVSEGLKFALGQNLVLLRSDGTKVFKPFLRWLVRGPRWWDQVGVYINVGAVFDSLKCGDIPGFRLPIPPLPEQRAIAHVLGTLDDKIELNRRMSQTLEAMAQALFKSWFVDFDPVRAKATLKHHAATLPQGGSDWSVQRARAYLDRMDPNIAALFPGSFVDSELGPIPEGWEVTALGAIATQRRNGVNPEQIDAGTPYIALEHMPKRCIALPEWDTAGGLASSKFRFEQRDILFGKLRPYFHKVGVAPLGGVCSTDIVVISPVSAEWFGFVLGHASSSEFVYYTDATSTGTKMPRTNWTDMSRYQIPLPSQELAEVFTKSTQPAIDRMVSSIHESRSLTALRDTLLPKVISGELRAAVGGSAGEK